MLLNKVSVHEAMWCTTIKQDIGRHSSYTPPKKKVQRLTLTGSQLTLERSNWRVITYLQIRRHTCGTCFQWRWGFKALIRQFMLQSRVQWDFTLSYSSNQSHAAQLFVRRFLSVPLRYYKQSTRITMPAFMPCWNDTIKFINARLNASKIRLIMIRQDALQWCRRLDTNKKNHNQAV